MIVKRAPYVLGLATLSMLGLSSLLLGSGDVPAGAKTLAAASAAGPASSVSPSTIEVRIDNFSFAPPAVKVAVGTTVTWVNHDDIPHTVVSQDKVLKSRVLDTDEKFSFAFTKAGRYPYFCSLHPKMIGEVVVQ